MVRVIIGVGCMVVALIIGYHTLQRQQELANYNQFCARTGSHAMWAPWGLACGGSQTITGESRP
jgi:hypothetical protein